MDVYKVSYTRQTDRTGNWEPDHMNVVADDGEQAVERAKKSALKESWNWEDDNGKKRKSRTTGFKLTGLDFVCELHD